MRIAIFCPSWGERAGIGHIAASLRAEFVRAGHDVLILARGLPDAAEAGVVRASYHQLPRRMRHVGAQLRFAAAFLPAAVRLRRAVRDTRCDVVLALAISTYAPLVVALAGVAPVVLSLQGGEPSGAFASHPRLFRHALRRAARVTACAGSLARSARALAPEAASRVVVVPNGVDPARFETTAAPVVRERPYVLAVGRLTRQKGFDVLIDAWARVEQPGIDLLVVGDGPDGPALREQAASAGLGGRVVFTGAAEPPAVAALLCGARLFVCPSRWEGLPLVCLEAMASGRAVVATNVDGIPDAVVHGVTGLLVPPDDPAALAVALAEALGDPARLASMGERGRARIASAGFAWPDVAARYLEIFARLHVA